MDFLTQLLLTAAHPFLYEHIGFWILRIDMRTIWNSYYNTTNVPTRLHLSQIKRISSSYRFFHLLTNWNSQHIPVTAFSLYKCKSVCPVVRRVDIGRIYSAVVQSLKFEWSIQITWKRKVAWKHKYLLAQQYQSWQTLQLSFLNTSGQVFYFHKTD